MKRFSMELAMGEEIGMELNVQLLTQLHFYILYTMIKIKNN